MKEYKKAVVEIEKFEVEDVIATSSTPIPCDHKGHAHNPQTCKGKGNQNK